MSFILQSIARFSEKYDYIPKLPTPISWFLGYRSGKQKPISEPLKWVAILLTTFAATLANIGMNQHGPLYTNHWHFTTFIPSFAASSILIYGSIDAPFSQPRNLVFGHFISGLIGVCIMKLFMTNSHNEKYLWISGSLSVAVASVIMDMTGTIHPPSGATAILPSIDDSVRELGWNYLPALLIQSLLSLGIAMLCNNLLRRYPKYWIAPPPAPKPAPALPDHKSKDVIVISEDGLKVPDNLELSDEESKFLRKLQDRLI